METKRMANLARKFLFMVFRFVSDQIQFPIS